MMPIALVGAAHIHTPRFVEILARREDVRVAAVWDVDRDRATRTAARLEAAVLRDPDAIWTDPAIMAVIVCSETAGHREPVMRAVESGKHLFVEKPLAIVGAEAHQLAEAIEGAGLIFSTGYLRRSTGAHRLLRDHIAAGHFGRITRIHASVAHAGALAGWFDGEWAWMADPARAGFGALGDCGTHAVDLILWLLGYGVEVERVNAWTGTVTGRYGTIDEYGHGTLQLVDGITATLWASWVDLAAPVGLTVAGTDAYATVAEGRLSYVRAGHGGSENVLMDMPDDLPHAFELFLDAVVTGAAHELVAPRQAARCCEIIEALYRAAAVGTWVGAPDRAL